GVAVPGLSQVPVGIALLVRPRIDENGEVTLKVHPMVSQVTSFSDQGQPTISSREADTTVRLGEDEALVIGGLRRRETDADHRRTVGLGDIPILGEAFRRRTRDAR